jgi:hypothetical protein
MFCASETLSAREEQAFATLRRFGGDHPRFLVVPDGLSPRFAHDDFRLLPLPSVNMESRWNADEAFWTEQLARLGFGPG